MKPTPLDNIKRILDWYHVTDTLVLENCRVEEDRIFAWVKDDTLLKLMIKGQWHRDPAFSAEHYHGSPYSFREPHYEPTLQCVLHFTEEPESLKYFVELDIDFHCEPENPIGHLGEVIENTVTRKKTDQAEVSRRLDDRFNGQG